MRLEEYLEQNGVPARQGSLAHHGVKGMHWGVRKAEKVRETANRNQRIADGTASKRDKIDQAILGKGMHGFGGTLSLNPKVAAHLAARYGKKADKLEARVASKERKAEAIAAHKKWKEEASGTEMANKVFQKAAKDFEKTADIINNDPNYKGKDVTKGLLAKHYQATMNHYFNEHMAQASIDLTLNDQGHAYIYQFDPRVGMMRGVEHKMVQHTDAKTFSMPDYKVELDEQGHMVGFSPAGELYHFGVKGMHWGVRKASSGNSKPRGKVRRGATKANTALNAGREVINKGEAKLIFLPQHKRNQAATRTQGRVLAEAVDLNRQSRFNGKDLKKNPVLREAYHSEIKKRALSIYQEELGIARTEAAAEFIQAVMSPSGDTLRMSAPRNRIQHEDSNDEVLLTLHFGLDGLGQIITAKADSGDVMHFNDEDFLEHYGVKGMHWGVRKDATDLGVPRKTAAKAKKDAEEFTRAKLFFGEGAGTRRKLIKATVEQRMSDPHYKKAFDHYVNQTDLSKRADQAKSQRRRKDIVSSTKKTARGVKNTILNNGAPVTITALAVAGVAQEAHARGLDKKAAEMGKQAVRGLFKHEDAGEDFLEHYGIKGMRWGVRREVGSDGRVDPAPVSVSQVRPGTKLTATGGENHPAHEDAKTAAAARQKAAKSTISALSNDEIQKAVRRMQLEQQYSQLMNQRQGKSAAKKGQEIVKGLLGMGKTVNEVMAFQNSPAGKELRKTIEKRAGGKNAA